MAIQLVQLPQVKPTNRPTPSPIPKAKKIVGPYVNNRPVHPFYSREAARTYARSHGGKSVMDARKLPKSLITFQERWFVFE